MMKFSQLFSRKKRTPQPEVTLNAIKQDLLNEVSAPALASIRQPWAASSVVAGLTPVKLARVLKVAAQGNGYDYLVLAEEMEERDPHYAAVLGTRKRAVGRMDVHVEPASDSKHDKTIADEVLKLVRRPAFKGLCADLLDGLGKGYSIVEIIWERGKKFTPIRFEHRDPKWFRFDLDNAKTPLLITEQNPMGEVLLPYKFAVHTPRLKTGIPLRGGLARLVAWSFLFKNYSIKDWAAFSEGYGMPLRLGRYGPNASKEDKEALFRAVANIGTDAAAILPESMRIEFQEAMKGSTGSGLFETMARFFDQQISKAVLGQTMTTEDGASQSQANVHDVVRVEISEDDAEQLANTLQRDVIQAYVDLNWGPQENYPSIKLRAMDEGEIPTWLAGVRDMVDRGLSVKQSEIHSKLGLATPEADDEILHPANAGATPAQADELVAQNTARAMNREVSPPDTDFDELETSDLVDWKPIVEPMLNPVRDLIDRSNTPQEVFDGLSSLIGEMDSAAFSAALAETLFKARGQGDAGV